jgi:formate hydrogenlyase transcriptional activator
MSQMPPHDLELLLDINNAITTIHRKDNLFKVITEKLKPIFKFDVFVVAVLDKEKKHIEMFLREAAIDVIQSETFQKISGERFRVDETPFEMILQNGSARLVTPDFLLVQFPNFAPLQAMKQFGIKQSLVTVLRYGGQTIGVMNMSSRQDISFGEKELALFEKIAEQISIAVSNAMAYEELEAREAETAMQLAIANALATTKNRDEMFLAVATEINKVVPNSFMGIRVQRPSGVATAYASFAKQKDGTFILSDEMVEGTVKDFDSVAKQIYEDVLKNLTEPFILDGEAFKAMCKTNSIYRHVHETFGVNSLLHVLLPISEESLAMLILSSRGEHDFSPRHAHVMARLAPQITMALKNLFAFEQIENLHRQLEKEKTYLVEEIKTSHNFEEIVGTSKALQKVLKQVSQVAPTEATVLIQGESGTGKELIARALHNLSPRKDHPLVKVNCAALPAQLIESELFGHEKGSFTGAFERRIGKFELANGGTIFLDEIGELPLELQSKLLRVLQERELERIGGKQVIKADIRVIAATNRDLQKEVAAGRFRTELFFRLNVFPLTMPPLRDRPEDIPLLAMFFASKAAKKMAKPIDGIKDKAMKQLMSYAWPGNIRELEHIIERAVILSTGTSLDITGLVAATPAPPSFEASELRTLADAERDYILHVLEQTKGRIRGDGGAATVLGMKPTTLESRMKKLGIRRASVFPHVAE